MLPPAPVGPAIYQLPKVFDLSRIPADQHRGQIGVDQVGHRPLPAVEGSVAYTVQTGISHDFDEEIVLVGRSQNSFNLYDFHSSNPLMVILTYERKMAVLFSSFILQENRRFVNRKSKLLQEIPSKEKDFCKKFEK